MLLFTTSSFRLRVVRSESAAGSHEQSLGGVHGAADQLRALGHRTVVHVAQGQHCPVMLGQLGQHALGDDAVELDVPVVGWIDGLGQLGNRNAEPVVPTAVV